MIIMDMATKARQVRKRIGKAKYGHLTKEALDSEINIVRERMDRRTAEIRSDLYAPPISAIQKLFTYLNTYFKES
jgi:hypothetical protein